MKPKDRNDSSTVDALEEIMDDVVETLEMTGQAAETARSQASTPGDQARAAGIRRQAEAMLDAAEEHDARTRQRRSDGDRSPTLH